MSDIKNLNVGDIVYQYVFPGNCCELEVIEKTTTETNVNVKYVYLLLCKEGCEITAIEKGRYLKVVNVTYKREYDEICSYHESRHDTNLYDNAKDAFSEYKGRRIGIINNEIKDLKKSIDEKEKQKQEYETHFLKIQELMEASDE